jgi:hypothetical protein
MGKVPKNSTFVAYELIHFFLPGWKGCKNAKHGY